ncbi:hypothetical protein ACF053_29610 [Streptomyces kanasensis]|uniref:hypothetical protein n=1 Tax=Streptomyces kanasensis TaxID=936756 RepID=UPI0036FF9263
MPLNVPVIIHRSPRDRAFTVHTDRQRWSAGQLAARPDGRAALEAAVREGVREAAPTCAYTQLTEPDIGVTAHADGSVTMTGRVLCDATDCHAAARRHHFQAAESMEAKAATEWAAQKELPPGPGEHVVVQKRVLTDHDRRQRRASLGYVLVGLLCSAAGAGMSQYDYHRRPDIAPGDSFLSLSGENFDAICNFLTLPALLAGLLFLLFGFTRLALTSAPHADRTGSDR